METVSDTIVNGRRKLVVKYTEAEKAEMKARAEQRKAEMQERMRKQKAS